MLNDKKYQETFSAHSHMYSLARVSINLFLPLSYLSPVPAPPSLQGMRGRETLGMRLGSIPGSKNFPPTRDAF